MDTAPYELELLPPAGVTFKSVEWAWGAEIVVFYS